MFSSVQSHFFFNGIPRLSYGWIDPNYAAAVIVSLIPFLWCRPSRRSLIFLGSLALLEVGLTCLLDWTYSRGAVAGWFSALVFYSFTQVLLKRTDARTYLAFALRFSIFLSLLWMTGLTRRIASIAAGDASALHRVAFWKGALRLIAASPWRGWGAGNAAFSYAQWIEEPRAPLRFHGLTNTYTHLGVEHGIGALALLILALVLPIVFCFVRFSNNDSESHDLLANGASSLVAFSVAGLFNSFWSVDSVVWAPLLVGGFLLILLRPNLREWRVAGGLSFAFALLVALGTFALAKFFEKKSEWRVTFDPRGDVALHRNRGGLPGPVLYFMPDERVLGAFFGQEIRGSIEGLPGIDDVYICDPGNLPNPAPGMFSVAIGSRVSDIPLRAIKGSLLLLPSVPPAPAEPPGMVLLPEFDQVGYSLQWKAWATSNHCAFGIVPMSGQNLLGYLDQPLSVYLQSMGENGHANH